jgi:RNA polymerase sigma factor (sigma-70 family)
MECQAKLQRRTVEEGGAVRDTERFERGGSAPATPLLPIYLREMGATPLLTKESEVEIARELQEAREACAKLFLRLPARCREKVLNGEAAGARRGRRWPLDRLEDSYERLQDYLRQNDDVPAKGTVTRLRQEKRRLDRARDAMILANLRLVTHIVKKYAKQGVPFMDLIQEGNIGLMRAVEKFEYEKGYKFSTYAYWWIKQAITRAIADKARMIRIPVHVGEKLKRVQRVTAALAEELGRSPSTREVARRMEIPESKVKELLELVQEPASLDSFRGEDEMPGALYFIADPNAADPLDRALTHEMKEKMRAALDVLDDREEQIIRLRFGIGHDEAHTLEEIGRVVNLSRERVRQIEGLALRKIQLTRAPHDLGKHISKN